ncbi:MAG: Gfo/Idh/MocA family oxidoreductase [Planctomycetota bacterium]|nr:Gfo/Idh/MocA family oxidoreductase [Planctomycetota bacterium]
MSTPNNFSRRFFMQSTAALGGLSLMPSTSWARVLGANERINFGVIGTGGMGHAHLRGLMNRRERDNITISRVCDVYQRRLNSATKIIHGVTGEESEGDSNSAANLSGGTMEYREVLDDPDIDAIVIATPDHWHTKIAIEAMDAGKDVYCEKPLSLTIQQALDCRDAVKRTGRVLQVGPQRTSDDKFWKARKAIDEGRIGKVSWSQGSYCRNSRGGQFNWHIDPDAGPKAPRGDEGYVWWDRWLGHEWDLAENIPWNADHFFRFRKYWAYNGGVATDLLYHLLAPLLLSISGTNGEYPRRVVASGGKYLEKDDRDIPDTFMMTVDYPSEHTVMLVSVMTNDLGLDTIIRGQQGTIKVGDHLTVIEQGTWWPEFRATNAGEFEHTMVRDEEGNEHPEPPPGQAKFEIFNSPRRDHMGNFIDSVRGEDVPNCNVDLGCATMVAIKMGVEAYRQNKTLMWDADNERVISR